MKNKIKNKIIVSILLTAFLLTSVFANAYTIEVKPNIKENKVTVSDNNKNIISAAIPTAKYEIKNIDQNHEILVESLGRLLIPGKPNLPSKIYSIAIPPGTEVTDVSLHESEGIILPGKYDIKPAQLPKVIGDENTLIYDNNYKEIYSSDEPYPSSVVEFVRTAGYRKYNLVDVRVTPFSYRPLSGQLTYYPEITIHISYKSLENPEDFVMIDNLERTEQIAEEIILNYDQAESWYPVGSTTSGGLHDFVIITLDSLTSSVTPLVNWETDKGRTVEVVTTSWIDSNYDGYDLAEKIRNFLREKYPSEEWGIEDVLMVGHYDDVPMRRCWQDIGYGMPETDFYYAELSLPDDESWDADGDHHWGEDSDPIDYYTEINVGRIPWSSTSTVQSICEKSVAYELNEDPAFKKNILLLGAFFWDDDPNPRTDNAVLMEYKVDSELHPWMSDWTMTRMYEEGYSTYPMDYDLTNSNVVSVWSSGTYGFVNWAGHGSPTACYRYHPSTPFITSSDCSQLNDDYPAIIFADACSNSDTDALNIGQAMLEQGSVGFVGATKVALGQPGWNDPLDGSSQSLDYYFSTYVTSGDYTQGEALQTALRDMYINGLWNYLKYETFEWGALWGNPDLGMGPPPFLSIRFPEGLPDLLSPYESTDITVRIAEGNEEYIEDTGTLHYRYDDGEFLTSPLIHVSDDLYLATLPSPECDDIPEFYFSAEGSLSGVIYEPPDAPTTVYSATVGYVAFTDDFETDQGWTVENIDITSGAWERGIPLGDGSRGDPTSDYDGSGQCYLTGNGPGNSDVDGGPTQLISPTIDLCGIENPALHYALWFSCDDDLPPSQDFLYVEISNDNGETWTLIESVQSNEGWIEKTVFVADYVIPTSQIKIRFSVEDFPNNSITEAGIDDFRIVISPCGVSDPDKWSMFRHDASHSGYTPHYAPNTNNTIWSYQIGYKPESSPAVVNGRVYIGTRIGYNLYKMYCFDAENGEEPIWTYAITGYSGSSYSSPAVVDEKLYFGSTNGNIYCLDAVGNGDGTTNELWGYTTGSSIYSSPTVVDGYVYIGSHDKNVYCLDADPFDDGADEGIDDGGASYDLIWSYQTDERVTSSPTVSGGKVYVGSMDGKLYCLDATDGTYLWNFTTGGPISYCSPAVVDGFVYFGSWDNNTYCIDTDGNLVWTYTTGGEILSSPTLAYGNIYIGSKDKKIYCLDATGNGDGTTDLIWEYETNSWVFSSPAVADGKVYVGSRDGTLHCLNAGNGNPKWSYLTNGIYPPVGGIASSPAITNGKIYITSTDGNLYAFGDS